MAIDADRDHIGTPIELIAMIGGACRRDPRLGAALRTLDVIEGAAVDRRVNDAGIPADHLHHVDLAFVGPCAAGREQPNCRPAASTAGQFRADLVKAIATWFARDELCRRIALTTPVREPRLVERLAARLDHQRAVLDPGVLGAVLGVILTLVIVPALGITRDVEAPFGLVDRLAVELVGEARLSLRRGHRSAHAVVGRAQGGSLRR